MDLSKIEKFIKDNSPNSFVHSERTAYWVEKLDPNASESMIIAAYLHDIERAFRKESTREISRAHGFDHPEYLRIHQEEGADIAAKFLKEEGCADSLIREVKDLISRHEVGGSDNENTLMEADTISFFETKSPEFAEQLREGRISKERAEEKFKFMIDRIKSDEAKIICNDFYKEFKNSLENI